MNAFHVSFVIRDVYKNTFNSLNKCSVLNKTRVCSPCSQSTLQSVLENSSHLQCTITSHPNNEWLPTVKKIGVYFSG